MINSVIEHIEQNSSIFNRIDQLIETSLIKEMKVEILSSIVISHAEKDKDLCKNLREVVMSGLVSNITIEFYDEITDYEDINTALAIKYLQNFMQACEDRDYDKSKSQYSKAYNIYHYKGFDKPKNRLAFNKVFEKAQFASLEFKAYRFINESRETLEKTKLRFISQLYENMQAAGFCNGEIDIYYHPDLAKIRLPPEVVNKTLMEELVDLILIDVSKIEKNRKNLPKYSEDDKVYKSLQSDINIYTNNIKSHIENYPISSEVISDYMLTNHNSETIQSIMK